MTIMTLIGLAIGLVLLVAGAEFLVRGAARLAASAGVPTLVVGLTVVAFGTSAPELAVSVGASLSGQADISIGNVVGSNIFNVLMILGLSAVIAPLTVARQIIRLDVPLTIGVSFLLLLFALDGRLQQTDGIVLLAGIVAYTVFAVVQGRKSGRDGEDDELAEEYHLERTGWQARLPAPWLLDWGLIALGLGLLVAGSQLLVDNAVTIARAMGVSELIVGLTIVSAGTSLPELATSVTASLRGQRDIAVGNVIGSNLFNILCVMGLSAAITPAGLTVPSAVLRFDLPVAIATAVACLPVFFSGNEISRWEGFLFIAYYGAYGAYLILNATGHDMLPAFNSAMLWFVLPLTAVTFAIVTLQTMHRRHHRSQS